MRKRNERVDKTVVCHDKESYNEQSIAECMETTWMGRHILFYESTDSTNVQAHLAARQDVPDGTLIVADMQTAGRGRRGRSWESPEGTNIYFSLLLRPNIATDRVSMLTLLMAYAVYQAVGEYVTAMSEKPVSSKVRDITSQQTPSLHYGIKWPNDIVLDGKKVCGILTEMYVESTSRFHMVIGVGINVKKQEFPSDMKEKATCLADNYNGEISRSCLLAAILKAFEAEYETFCNLWDLSTFKEKFNECLVNKDRAVWVLDPKGEYGGIARGINDQGELLVELADGTIRTVYAGEVSVRGIYGYV